MKERSEVGVKVATFPAHVTVPATEVFAGPVTVKLVDGDVRVRQFNGSLNVAARA